MSPTIQLIIRFAEELIEQCKSGACDEDEYTTRLLADTMRDYLTRNEELTSTQAANLLGIAYSTFTLYVREGKLSPGIKHRGITGLRWKKSILLDEYRRLRETMKREEDEDD